MKQIVKLFFCVLALLLTGCSGKENYNTDVLDPHEKDEFIDKIIRYVAKPPDNIRTEEKFDAKYNDHYRERASQCKLEQYYKNENVQYFLVSQPAPSLTVKRHATGGKIKTDDQGNIIEYEEVFRTWKMVPDTLVKRSCMLFD